MLETIFGVLAVSSMCVSWIFEKWRLFSALLCYITAAICFVNGQIFWLAWFILGLIWFIRFVKNLE